MADLSLAETAIIDALIAHGHYMVLSSRDRNPGLLSLLDKGLVHQVQDNSGRPPYYVLSPRAMDLSRA